MLYLFLACKEFSLVKLHYQLFLGFFYWQTIEKASILIHSAIFVYGNDWGKPIVPKEPYVCDVAKRAHHHKASAFLHLSICIRPDRHLFAKYRGYRMLALQALVSLILWIIDYHCAGAYQLRPCCRDYYVFASLLDLEFYVIEEAWELAVFYLSISYRRLTARAPVVDPLILIDKPIVPKIDECVLCQ